MAANAAGIHFQFSSHPASSRLAGGKSPLDPFLSRLLAQTTLRNTMGTRPLHEILSERETISGNMQIALDEATEAWGIKVERVEMCPVHARSASRPLGDSSLFVRLPRVNRVRSARRSPHLHFIIDYLEISWTTRRPLVVNAASTRRPPVDKEWTPKVEAVLVGKDVRLPVQLQRAMAAEAEAAREARAKVIAAEGEQKASRALREASEVIGDSPAALQLRYLQLLALLASRSSSAVEQVPYGVQLFGIHPCPARDRLSSAFGGQLDRQCVQQVFFLLFLVDSYGCHDNPRPHTVSSDPIGSVVPIGR
ncbi:hypothetical protein MSG28_001199 [Choristoneura fumiferana]|uniref:Uncharacterized protein n=1 Tax=Choristoneura fumiferana TaxID=7141 RepID=A0ACC0K486_CHOFU|nr:hypothetical protein MSG28_001199 [Choristoneura fumiferana]